MKKRCTDCNRRRDLRFFYKRERTRLALGSAVVEENPNDYRGECKACFKDKVKMARKRAAFTRAAEAF